MTKMQTADEALASIISKAFPATAFTFKYNRTTETFWVSFTDGPTLQEVGKFAKYGAVFCKALIAQRTLTNDENLESETAGFLTK